ncbi:MAG: MoxR family ATPase [Saprospiraceae bacterium]|nr:MoxR family ATPase [Saprospiraceae bacterium]
MLRYINDIKVKTDVKRPDGTPLSIAPYFPSTPLRKAVNMAIALKRPLLLKGEPGCGKTRLALAVAYDLYGNDCMNHYFEWNIKSATKASDGIYTFDHIRRLRDSQFDKVNNTRDSDNLPNYIEKGALAQAFEKSKIGKPAILLIDEIDKADIDFPNDLLLELDQKRLEIPELLKSKNPEWRKQGNITAEESPIIFITSNDEKELPQAFLRRCLFHYVDFPDTPDLEKIVKANFTDFDEKIRLAAIKKFELLRGKMGTNAEKNVSTSELLDWISLIKHFETPLENIEKDGVIEHFQALLKSRNDVINFNKK